MKRTEIADLIVRKLESNREALKAQYDASKSTIGYFFIDDLLPAEIAQSIYRAFPPPTAMTKKKTLREYKYIAAQMNVYDPLLEEAIYAFQDPRIVKFIGEICEIKSLIPDENLYAGGISLMGVDNYLNPHIDNSHDKDRAHWRVLNLLYYVSPDWKLENGGNLELWPKGIEDKQTTIVSKFNRLAVMATHNLSWHSVSPIKIDQTRCCVSNYYFSQQPLRAEDSFHVTSFRGRPEQGGVDFLLRLDSALRMGIRKLFPKGAYKVKHVYDKQKQD